MSLDSYLLRIFVTRPFLIFDWYNFTYGIAQSVIGSAIFLIALFYFVKPNIAISPTIVSKDLDGRRLFIFKIVNRSFFYKAFDIKYELISVEPNYSANNGKNISINEIRLLKNGIPFLDSFIGGARSEYSTHAVRFATDHDISGILNEKGKYLQLQIIARHGLSGLPQVFVKKYYSKSCLSTTGDFKSGWSLSVE